MRWKPQVRFGGRAGETDLSKDRYRTPVRSHLVGDALDVVRRELWQELRQLPDSRFARNFMGSR
jgi:hypothetical protein